MEEAEILCGVAIVPRAEAALRIEPRVEELTVMDVCRRKSIRF
jgi:hypothetical protein